MKRQLVGAILICTAPYRRSNATILSAFDVCYPLNSGAKADIAGGPR
jgi:hypothetical protein